MHKNSTKGAGASAKDFYLYFLFQRLVFSEWEEMAGSDRHTNQLLYTVAPPLSIMTDRLHTVCRGSALGITIKKPHPVNRAHITNEGLQEYTRKPLQTTGLVHISVILEWLRMVFICIFISLVVHVTAKIMSCSCSALNADSNDTKLDRIVKKRPALPTRSLLVHWQGPVVTGAGTPKPT